jgi:predicted dehydrogenase
MQRSLAAMAATGLPAWYAREVFALEDETKKPETTPIVMGAIGLGSPQSRNRALVGEARKDKGVKYVAVCDVDARHRAAAAKMFNSEVKQHEDFRELLDNKEINAVTIAVPDHWHALIAIDALRKGKDVYCEKPLVLTVAEGQALVKAAKDTGRIFQTGSQQRTEFGGKFRLAAELVRNGRIGKIQTIETRIDGNPTSPVLPKVEVPKELNWDLWLGPAPMADYVELRKDKQTYTRCPYEFRWWYEYSGGKLTDWGAHHVDIAQWAIGKENAGPHRIEVVYAAHPVALRGGFPLVDDRYNTATAFQVRCLYDNGVELIIRDDTENGITFEGANGAFFVSRGKLTGEPVDDLVKNPIPESVIIGLRKGKRIDTHMGNFIECARDRAMPVSDVFSHHRNLTTCHLANIAIRLGRNLRWNPDTEQIVGDDEANAMQRREQRSGYSV